MDQNEQQRLHGALQSIGMRAQGTAVGLLQLCRELMRAGVLDQDGVARIRDAIVGEIALSCPRSQRRDEYEARVRERLDGLMTPPPLNTIEPEHHTTQ